MSKQTSRHVPKNTSSIRPTMKSAVETGTGSRSTEFINYTASDTYRREIILKAREVDRKWTEKFDPWFTNEYRQMYDNMAKVHGISREKSVISLKRPEWQQPTNVFPSVHQRLNGQRRRRVLGAFPQTENDKIGWRVLPQQAFESYERASAANNFNVLRKQSKFSNWPIESLY